MSKSEEQCAGGSGQWAVKRNVRTVLYCLLLTANCLLLLGCRQDMQDQPRYEVYESSGFFKDGLSSRSLVPGTVPRGYLRADRQLFTGQKDKTTGSVNSGSVGQPGTLPFIPRSGNAEQATNSTGEMQQQPAGDPNDVEEFPFPVTAEVLNRGQERYQIFCSMCHGYTGEGDGMIVRRGFRPPPSYHEKRLQQAPVGYFFRVITEGFGAMPSYKSQVPVQDRWAIIAYVRALQLSKLNQQQAAPAAAPATTGGEPGGHQ
jgi:mono/diheme cytochrome c family protein